jgi:hypothetical protein
MNLDQQLRAALGQEAERRIAPPPDMDGLIRRGRARRRRRNLARVGVAAAVAVLVAGGVYGGARITSGTAVEPAQAPSTTAPQTYRATRTAIEPGTYRMFAGVDATGAVINADITFDAEGWQADDYPVLGDAESYGAVAVYQPLALAAGTGCATDKPNAKVDKTPQKLSQQLAHLPRSTVVQPPTRVHAFGHPAVYLRLRINQDCGAGVYRVAQTPRGGHGITYISSPYSPGNAVVIDFWVVQVGGVPVVVDAWHDTNASSHLVRQITRVRDSIALVTSG